MSWQCPGKRCFKTGAGAARLPGAPAMILLPTISVDQYGATLASWFGLSASQIGEAFPNLANFTTRNLGFLS